MPFVKTIKDKAYHKRFQVKFRRRREGRTDYYARKRLITQDKNKYNTRKYRLVVRFSNKNVTAQIIYSTLDHDETLCAAYSAELPRFGVKAGLTNYAASYCTGLLLARRLLAERDASAKAKGADLNLSRFNSEEDVEAYYENQEGSQPFKVILDSGLKICNTGSRIFAVLKGAVDGGLNIPHHNDRNGAKEHRDGKRFPGYDLDEKAMDWDVLQKYIIGGHVSEYMEELQEEDPEAYTKQFSAYEKAGVNYGDLEGMYTGAHAAIRKDPSRKNASKADVDALKAKYKGITKHEKRLTHEQREARVNATKADYLKELAAAAEEDDDDEDDE
jgi:large subunit ribosomal protein L5e